VLIPSAAPTTAFSKHLAESFAAIEEDAAPSDPNIISDPSAPPPPPNQKSATSKNFTDLGLPEDGYDYSQHLRPSSSTGEIFLPNGERVLRSQDPLSKQVGRDSQLDEVDRNYESITIDASLMDHDIKQSLFNFDDNYKQEEGDVDGDGEDMFGEEGGLGDLLDDFIEVANMEKVEDDELQARGYAPLHDPNAEEKAAAFDWEAHIKMLIAKSNHNTGNDVVKRAGFADEFKGVKARRGKKYEDDEESDDAAISDDDGNESDDSGYFDDDLMGEEDDGAREFDVNAPIPERVGEAEREKIREVTEQFAALMDEYDSDEIGELEYNAGGYAGGDTDSEDESEDEGGNAAVVEEDLDNVPIVPDGHTLLRDVENDTFINSILDAHLEDKNNKDKDYTYMAPKERKGGSSYTALINGKLVSANDGNLEEALENLNVEEETVPAYEQLAIAMERLGEKPVGPDAELRFDGKSYYDEKTVNPWDCESVLSTYSNLDNNPHTIATARRRKQKKKQQPVPAVVEEVDEAGDCEEQYEKIVLSEKTGLPIAVSSSIYKPSVVEEDLSDCEYEDVVDKGNTRSKDETPEEKKARKKAVKAEREARRNEKREMRGAYAVEIKKRTGGVNRGGADGSDVKVGNSVFKYS
jgi:hypothetical protein